MQDRNFIPGGPMSLASLRLVPIPESVKSQRRTAIKSLLREYCDKRNIQYRNLTKEQALEALKQTYSLRNRNGLDNLLRNTWIFTMRLQDVLARVQAEVDAEKAKIQTR